MKTFLSTCLLLVILCPVLAIKCITEDETKQTAEGTCDINGEICFSEFTEIHLDDPAKIYRGKGCTTNRKCIPPYSFSTVENKYLRHIKGCCRRSLCNEDPLPTPSRTLNGLECPSGEASNNIKCYDQETQCIDIVLVQGGSKVPNKSVKGCATESFCRLAWTDEITKYYSGTVHSVRCLDSDPPIILFSE